MLPFCRFMNIEELVQDVILSLLGELPPVKKVKDIKARTKAIQISQMFLFLVKATG